jgi:hypothetical protein
MRRYGPMHQFWTYSGERLNFVLKSINNNGHGGGEREHTYMSMFRLSQASFDRVSRYPSAAPHNQLITPKLTSIASNPNDKLSNWATQMLNSRRDLRGTACSEQVSHTGMN